MGRINTDAILWECVFVVFADFFFQNFEKKTFQDPLKKPTARALMAVLACSPTAQKHAAKGISSNLGLDLVH